MPHWHGLPHDATPDSSITFEADWSKNPYGDFDYERQKRLRGTVGGGFDWRNILPNVKRDAGLLLENISGLMDYIPSASFPTAESSEPDLFIRDEDAINFYKNKETTPVDLYKTPLEGDDRGIGKAFIIHHTTNRREAKLVDKWPHKAYYPLSPERGVHFVINPDGAIYQMTPTGMRGGHVGFGKKGGAYVDPVLGTLDNTNTMGVEIVAKNDAGVTDAQIESALRLAARLGYKKHEIIPHGKYWEVGDVHKEHGRPTEGNKVMSALWGASRQFYEHDPKAGQDIRGPAEKFRKLREQLFGPVPFPGEAFL
jgi:hypothetical protein